jgi:hypothetical protein
LEKKKRRRIQLPNHDIVGEMTNRKFAAQNQQIPPVRDNNFNELKNKILK